MTSGTTSAANPPIRFRLRDDLRVSAAEDGGFVLEDPRAGKFYRLGPAEYAVIAQLDGQTDLREAFVRAAGSRAAQQLTTERCTKLPAWLLASGLVEMEPRPTARPSAAPAPAAPNFNFCYFRYSLGDPSKLLVGVERGLGWLFSLPAVLVVALVSLGAAVFVFQQWTNLTTSLSGILCPDQHLALLGCWLVLKTAHEIGHAVACRRLGGDVREWGLAFIYLTPVPYTDVTSSWRFSSRFDRMAVAAAGMYVEWILALVALLVWSCSSNAAVQHLCVYTISLATVTTVLFNANPLCRLDGYYILSDLLGWPNFSAQAQRVTGSFFRRVLGGAKDPGESTLAGQHYWLVLAYGIAAAVWRWLALITMAVVVLLAYEGLGALLIGAALFTWYGPFRSTPAKSLSSWLSDLFHKPQVALRLAAIAFGCVLLSVVLPWPFAVTAPGIVESTEQHTVRARAAGQVIALHVVDGQWVEAGEPLAVLQNDQLAFELKNLELALAHGEAKLRSLHSKRQLVDFQVEQQRQETLALQVAEQRRKIDELTLKAPAAGRVVARRLADVPGSYLAEGAEFCTLVGPDLKFRFSIAEDELPYFVEQQGKSLQVRFPGRTISGTFSELEPHASADLFDPALGAAAGGPLPVTARESAAEKGSKQSGWLLTRPRVTGTISFASQEIPGLTPGQRGSAALATGNRSLWAVVTSRVSHWIAGLRQRVQSQRS